MNSQTLLETYGKAASVVKAFYLNKFIESMNTENVPENYKEFAMEQGIDNDTVAKMIDAMPRALFDAFDAHEVFIQIIVYPDKKFTYNVNEKGTTKSFNTRKEAEAEAIEGAFEILNDKL